MAQEEEAAEPGAGHNGPDEGEFRGWVRKIVAANQRLDEAKAERQAVRKLAKAAGIELKKLDAVVAMADWEPNEIREHFAQLQQYAVWMGFPVGSQLDLFAGVAEASKPALDWESRGFVAATTGKGAVGRPPDNCPAANVQDWMKGWERGQAANAPKPISDDAAKPQAEAVH